MLEFLNGLTDRVIKGGGITCHEASRLMEITRQSDIVSLICFANRIREEFKGPVIDLCAIINAKSGSCGEDCAFCSQSAHYRTDINEHPLAERADIVEKAREAIEIGANSFSIVVSGKNIWGADEMESICMAIEDIASNAAIGRCASLGILTRDAAKRLRKAGLERYHHNLETSESFFPGICTTHSYHERVETVRIAREEGLQVCCGGLFGLGETGKHRLELAFALKELDVDSIPLNFLTPIPGTPLENVPSVPPMEILKIIAVFRFIHPTKDVRICGGRGKNMRNTQSLMYLAGANAIMVGDYLTTPGSDPKEDLQLIEDLMLIPRCKDKGGSKW